MERVGKRCNKSSYTGDNTDGRSALSAERDLGANGLSQHRISRVLTERSENSLHINLPASYLEELQNHDSRH